MSNTRLAKKNLGAVPSYTLTNSDTTSTTTPYHSLNPFTLTSDINLHNKTLTELTLNQILFNAIYQQKQNTFINTLSSAIKQCKKLSKIEFDECTILDDWTAQLLKQVEYHLPKKISLASIHKSLFEKRNSALCYLIRIDEKKQAPNLGLAVNRLLASHKITAETNPNNYTAEFLNALNELLPCNIKDNQQLVENQLEKTLRDTMIGALGDYKNPQWISTGKSLGKSSTPTLFPQKPQADKSEQEGSSYQLWHNLSNKKG